MVLAPAIETSTPSIPRRGGLAIDRPRNRTFSDNRFTVGSLFSGMGGCLGGAIKAGFKALWASDFDPDCCATLRHRFPNVPVIEKPIQDVSVWYDDLSPVDLLVAGFPCQSFSIGGRRAGFDDERGQAVFDIFRLLHEWGQLRPKIVLLENVPNFATGNGGEWLTAVSTELRRAGYWFSAFSDARILNTFTMAGLPQDRDRLFMVACSIDAFNGNVFSFPDRSASPKPLHQFVDRRHRASAWHYLPESNRFATLILNEIDRAGNDEDVFQIRRYYARRKGRGLCPTLTANMGVGGHNVPFVKDNWGVRKLTVDECAALQGFDPAGLFPDWIKPQARYRMIGNAVTEPIASALAYSAVRALQAKVTA